jgi:hypothetical protein
MEEPINQDEDALTVAYKRIKELEAENKRLRSAALEVYEVGKALVTTARDVLIADE